MAKNVRDNVNIENLSRLDKVLIPVDIQVARASLATGVVRGHFSGNLEDLFGHIRESWFRSVKGLKIKGRSMMALDVDEPLRHLSKRGCTHRNKATGECSAYSKFEAKDFCVRGSILIGKQSVNLET